MVDFSETFRHFSSKKVPKAVANKRDSLLIIWMVHQNPIKMPIKVSQLHFHLTSATGKIQSNVVQP